MKWSFYNIFYFVCQVFRFKDMAPQSLSKMPFSQNRQLYTTFTSQFHREILI
jgi:hypothetical protein